MINLKSLKCECGCQDKINIELDSGFQMTLIYIDQKYGLKINSIISGYRCTKRIQELIELAKNGKGNMPAKNGEHTKYPIMACDILHDKIKDIFKEMVERHPNDYGIGFYINKDGLSIHIDSRPTNGMKWVCNHGIYIYQNKNLTEYNRLLNAFDLII